MTANMLHNIYKKKKVCQPTFTPLINMCEHEFKNKQTNIFPDFCSHPNEPRSVIWDRYIQKCQSMLM